MNKEQLELISAWSSLRELEARIAKLNSEIRIAETCGDDKRMRELEAIRDKWWNELFAETNATIASNKARPPNPDSAERK